MALSSKNSELQRTLEVVVIDDLKVDHRYQRTLNQNHVEQILENWDPVAADALIVSRRKNGDLYCVNGQHEAAAAKLKGETEMLAFVYEGLTPAREADLRLKANNRRGDTSLERFWAQVAAGNKESRAIVKLLEKYETEINKSPTKHTGINCVSAVEALYRDDDVLLERTLQAIAEAHGAVKGEQAKVPVIRGTFWFLKVHDGDYHWRSLIERMRLAGPDDLMRRARSFKAIHGGPDWLNYYRATLESYNHRRQEHTRLETRTKFSSISDDRWTGRKK